MKRYPVAITTLFFSCFVITGFAQQTKSAEPNLFPIHSETFKVVNQMDKESQPVKKESKPASADQTKAKEVEKPKAEKPKVEKPKNEKVPVEQRDAEKPKYINKGR